MELSIKKEIMRVVKSVFFILSILLLYSCSIKMSNEHLTGRIVDKKNIPIENVTILLKLKDSLNFSEHYIHGAISKPNGDFVINLGENLDDYALYIGKVGYNELIIKDLRALLEKNEIVLTQDTSTHVDLFQKIKNNGVEHKRYLVCSQRTPTPTWL